MYKSAILIAIAGLLSGSSSLAGTNQEVEARQTAPKEGLPMNHGDYHQFQFVTIIGDTTKLADFEGKVLLLVNVASQCGYTKQYTGLEELYRKYKDKGLTVIGFPANNFGQQEPGTDEEIMTFCKTNYNVTFPMMSKISVKGDDIHPLFEYLTEKSNLTGEIKWNFSKFLLDKKGNLVARYPSATEPMSEGLVTEIEKLF